jgi:hypothetical protein
MKYSEKCKKLPRSGKNQVDFKKKAACQAESAVSRVSSILISAVRNGEFSTSIY